MVTENACSGYGDQLSRLVTATPDMTVAEMQKQLDIVRIRLAYRPSRGSLSIWAITIKKRFIAAEEERADVKAPWIVWRNSQHILDTTRLVFIDETGAATNMARATPLQDDAGCVTSPGHWKTPFTAALRHNGLLRR